MGSYLLLLKELCIGTLAVSVFIFMAIWFLNRKSNRFKVWLNDLMPQKWLAAYIVGESLLMTVGFKIGQAVIKAIF